MDSPIDWVPPVIRAIFDNNRSMNFPFYFFYILKPWALAQELYAMGVSQGGESEFSPLGRRPRGFPEQAKFIWEKYPGRKPGDFYCAGELKRNQPDLNSLSNKFMLV